MNNPKERQQWIYDLLISKPTLSYGDCFAKFSPKFAKSKRTFDKDWKKANERIKEYQKTIEKEKLSVSIETEKEAVKRDILSKHEAMELLTKIAKGTASKIGDKLIIPTNNDKIKAISELAKYEGWYAPIKQDTNIRVEQPLFPED